MRKLSCSEICNLNEIMIGGTEPIGETNYDQEVENNLMRLIDLGDWVLDGLYFAAQYHNRAEYSMKQVGERAKAAMMEWRDGLSLRLDELEAENDELVREKSQTTRI